MAISTHLSHKVKRIFLFTSLLLGVFLFAYIRYRTGAYDYLSSEGFKKRGIETAFKLWKNGYGGAFFRFEYLGFLPLFFGTIFIGKSIITETKWTEKRKRFSALVIFVTLIIALKGYLNFRYQMTLFPLFLFLLMFEEWKREKLKMAIIILGILGSFVWSRKFYNFKLDHFTSKETYNYQMVHLESILEIKNLVGNKTFLACSYSFKRFFWNLYPYGGLKSVSCDNFVTMFVPRVSRLKHISLYYEMLKESNIELVLVNRSEFEKVPELAIAKLLKSNGKEFYKNEEIVIYQI
ncbi:MAG: hypothetical protein H6621_04430 [Halobacteriovoraceae bacterium]|nr:hypothetical protein [Halobacteriovoraceae bacterium]